MRKNTDKKLAPILCAAVAVVVLGIFLVLTILPLLGDSLGELACIAAVVFYGLVTAAVIAGVIAALRQRLKEIDSGEEEESKKY